MSNELPEIYLGSKATHFGHLRAFAPVSVLELNSAGA